MFDYLLLQINDALFPIGGYSHSYGLETYIQKDLLNDTKDIENYIDNKLKYSIFKTEILGARLAYENAENTKAISELDGIMTAAKSPMEIRSASIKLGSRFIKTLSGCKVELKYDYFSQYMNTAYRNKHHCIAYGVVCRSADIAEDRALSAYLYAQCSAMITNLVKLVPLSQSVGQELLYSRYQLMERLASEVMGLDEKELCASAPAFDIRCMQHEKLYSRLYMS